VKEKDGSEATPFNVVKLSKEEPGKIIDLMMFFQLK
jgi:hypothetical protein